MQCGALENKGLTIRFSVKNTSERGGYIVPQIYVTDVAASTVRRVKELKAFQKVWLDAGQERTVSLQLGKEAFCLWNQKMKYVAEPGVFRIELSDSAANHMERRIYIMYLIPAPAKLEKKEGRFIWAYDRYVTVDQSCSQLVTRQASLFCDGAEKELGYRPLLTRGAAQAGDVVFKQDDTMKAQSYVLDITEDAIVLTGDEAGLWHGMQTLLQILEQEGACLSALHIEDAPAIVNRGYYFDCTRGRIPKLSWLKQLADRMAYYKLNQLQLYVEHSYLFRGMTELWRDDTPLTAEEIMEFDRYCAERGIELVPSLSSFGHLYKLLCSREYSHLCELEDSEGKPFSQTGRMAHHTINTSDPESLQLIEGMISEYMELFTSRQFNICADETFDLGRGRNKEAVEKLGKDRVYIDYIKKLAQFLLDNGRRPCSGGILSSASRR